MTDQSMRDEFEAWASRDGGYDIEHHAQIEDRYAAPSATRAWVAWQAAWAASRAKAVEELKKVRDGKSVNYYFPMSDGGTGG